MATTTSDKRIVRVSVTSNELTALLGAQAQAAGLITFSPDEIEVIDNGDSFEVVFYKATV